MKWFKHDADASIDAKLQELLLDYGASGYGLYWYCVELIAQNVNESNITFELEHDARIIARNLNLTIQETKDMMKKMIDLGLFSIAKNEKLACYALAKRLDQSMTSNVKFRELISNIKNENHDFIMTESVYSHDKVMQEEKRREEKRRDKTIKEENKEVTIVPNITYSEASWNVAQLLLKNILLLNPTFKIPKIEIWCRDIDKAMRIDGRTTEQLINCINWIYSAKGQFWQKNILSGAKLREKFDTMNMQVISKPTNQKDTLDDIYARGLTATEVVAEMVRREENK